MASFGHPIDVIGTLRDNYGDSLTLEFSRYAYRPQTILDERELFEVPISNVNPQWLAEELCGLPLGWELAINSRVSDARGRTFHIPMIDFMGRRFPAGYSLFEGILGVSIVKRMVFFDSGRSFHSYSPILLSPKEWVDFMGRILLLNLPGQEQFTDARWVGHRLMGGYAALRWSNNTGAYLNLPVGVTPDVVFKR